MTNKYDALKPPGSASEGGSDKNKSSAQVAPLVVPKAGGVVTPVVTDADDAGEETEKRIFPKSIRYPSEAAMRKAEAKAEQAGMSFNAYAVAVTLGSDYKPPINPDLKEALLKVFHELTRQGNNLNQIARHLNRGTATKAQGETMIETLGRSLMSAHRAVRDALAQNMPQP